MGRIRTIKPEFPQSESIGRISREARLCFILLWTLVDDSGRTRASSRLLASLLYPYDDDAPKLIPKWLKELEKERCIDLYEVGGNTYLEVCKFNSHQKIDKPSPSKIPAFDESSRVISEGSATYSIKEGIKDKYHIAPSAVALEAAAGTLLLASGKEWSYTQTQIGDWSNSYPAVDISQQLQNMKQWCISHPQKRKTERGILAFITNWLSKKQDEGPKMFNGFNHSSSSRPLVLTDPGSINV